MLLRLDGPAPRTQPQATPQVDLAKKDGLGDVEAAVIFKYGGGGEEEEGGDSDEE